MIAPFANLFGYILNFIYEIFKNYGVAIILFSVLLKIVLLPISIKQQKVMKKTTKIQEKSREIQEKYKNDPQKMNQEIMDLYKKENMSPFSGCFSAIIQIILLFAMFYLVRSPLTYMKKIDSNIINNYINEIKTENIEINSAYPEISVIREKGNEDNSVYINMDFLGLDLSQVPTTSLNDYRVYIIPILYVLSSFISMKITTNMNNKKEENMENKEQTELEMAQQMTKNMNWMMPFMSVSISLVAPLGLALYWLVNNILMICERLILNKFLESKEDK